MSEPAGLIDYVLTVKANSFENVITHGTGFYVASPENANLEIETPDGGRFSCGVGEGAKHLNPFNRLIIRNNEPFDQQVKLKIGFGEFIASAGGGGSALAGTMVQVWGGVLDTNNQAFVIPANVNRKKIKVINSEGSTARVIVTAVGYSGSGMNGILAYVEQGMEYTEAVHNSLEVRTTANAGEFSQISIVEVVS